jgi:hypothetical protein
LNAKRIPALDGLRGIAILMVLLWHAGFDHAMDTTMKSWPHLVRAGQLTWSGVDLFFVISGFLIGGHPSGRQEFASLLQDFLCPPCLPNLSAVWDCHRCFAAAAPSVAFHACSSWARGAADNSMVVLSNVHPEFLDGNVGNVCTGSMDLVTCG